MTKSRASNLRADANAWQSKVPVRFGEVKASAVVEVIVVLPVRVSDWVGAWSQHPRVSER